ncbi:MAG: hypothetical protein WA906_08035 [Pacificimonas sp.]
MKILALRALATLRKDAADKPYRAPRSADGHPLPYPSEAFAADPLAGPIFASRRLP